MSTNETVTALDALFAPWNRSDAPGLVVGIVKDGVVIYRRGFGMASLETGIANRPGTRMRIASISKHFAALLALLLAQEGKLDLDAPIRTYIPELTGPGGDPSLRLLLQHRGGSRCFIDIGFLCRGQGAPPVGTALAIQVRQTGRNFVPGAAMIYNNGGYHLVSIAIERVGGVSFEAQLKARLFDPLGMADTTSIPSDYTITPGIATMHVPLPGGGWRRGLFPSEEMRGEGAIVSTIDDMLRWAAHLRARDRFGSPSTWQALLTRPRFPDGTVGTYALGLVLNTYRGLSVMHHSGGVSGGSSQMLTFPEQGLDIVILANGAPEASPTKLAERVADIVLAGYLGEPPAIVSVADYESLLGDWWSPETGMVYSVAVEGKALKLQICGQPSALLLERCADGHAYLRATSLGEIKVMLDQALSGDDLIIEFGGRPAAYRRLSKEATDAEAFARAVAGEYRSHDGDCIATIAREGELLIASFSDSLGRIRTHLTCLGETVAATTPVVPTDIHYSALSFQIQSGKARSFRLNSVRTRNLLFAFRASIGQLL